ncbi:MAG: porin family protein [bacterium]|nr:porin family protein [bacterium]
MKRIFKILTVGILSAVLIGVFSLPVFAQAQEGRKFKVNTLMEVNNEKFDFDAGGEIKSTGYNVLGGVGFFMWEMFEVGPEISFGQVKIETENGGHDETKLTDWAIGARINAHFNPTGKICPYIGANLAFANRKYEYEQPIRYSTDDSTFLYGAQVGVDYFLAEHISFNPELRYTMGKFSFDGQDADYTNISLMIGFAFLM